MNYQTGQRISVFRQEKHSEAGTSRILHPEGSGRSLCLLKLAEKPGLLETKPTDLWQKTSEVENIRVNWKSVLSHTNEHCLFFCYF